jgi:uncharacterized protein YbaR (Trm112 family)
VSATAPPTTVPAFSGLPLVCPQCRGPLTTGDDSLHCHACPRTFPIHAGIPDLRVFADPYLSVEEDGERTDRVLQALDRLPLPELLRYYWSLSDITPPDGR